MNFQKRLSSLLASSLLLVICTIQVSGQNNEVVAPSPELMERILQLEAQIATMREELDKLKKMSQQGGPSEQPPVRLSEASARVETEPARAASATSPQSETKSAANGSRAAGIDLGPVNVIPYGTIYLNAFSNSGGSNNADVPLFATPSGTGNLGASARQTRLGLRFEGPPVLDAKLTGAIEADFFGGFPAVGIGENFGIVRLRQAFARLDWESSAMELGQDWIVFAPANPVSLTSAGIPLMAAAGNAWARLPQVRYERRWRAGTLNWQGALLAPPPATPIPLSCCNPTQAHRPVCLSFKVGCPLIKETGSG